MLSTLLSTLSLPLLFPIHIHLSLFGAFNNTWFYYYSLQSLPSSSICSRWVVRSAVRRLIPFCFFLGVKGKRFTRWLSKNTGMFVSLDITSFAISPILLSRLHLSFWELLAAYKALHEHFRRDHSGLCRSLLIQSPCLLSASPLRMCKSSLVYFSAAPLSSFGRMLCLQDVGPSYWFIG